MQNSRTIHNSLVSSTAPRAYRDPVWKGSHRGEIKFVPVSSKLRAQIWRKAKRLESRTRSEGPFGYVNGAISRVGLCVLNALLFDFHNGRTGQCDPSYKTLAYVAGVSVRSVGRAIERLRKAGLLSWLRRCSGTMVDGRYMLEQDTNAYQIRSEWGAEPGAKPERGTWGAHPSLPGALETAAMALESGAGPIEVQRALELEPGDNLARSLAALARARN